MESVLELRDYSVEDFNAEFPDEDTCLEWLKDRLYPNGINCPKCGRITKHHRVARRRSYSCDRCGHHVHPAAGTIFHKSRTSLRLWFYAIFLVSRSGAGVSTKQLERELGVTYKTASRMLKEIRALLDAPDGEESDGALAPERSRIEDEKPQVEAESEERALLSDVVVRAGRRAVPHREYVLSPLRSSATAVSRLGAMRTTGFPGSRGRRSAAWSRLRVSHLDLCSAGGATGERSLGPASRT